MVVGSLADNVERSTLALGDGANPLDVLLFNNHTHALLRLVADDFLRRQCWVANWKSIDVDVAASSLHEFRQSVEVAACTVVVDRDNRVGICFGQCANHVGNTFLHFRVGTLHGIEFDGVVVLSGVDRRHSAAAHTDAVVIATHQHHTFVRLRLALDGIALCSEADTTGKHDNLVVGKLLAVLLMLERKHRAADERLAELVTEVGSAI